MKIELNLKDCDKCGVYLNLEKVEKNILTIKSKEYFGDEIKYIYITGFTCPVCKQLHIKRDYSEHDIKEGIKLDEDINDSLHIEEYFKNKLNITERYYSFKFYGDEED